MIKIKGSFLLSTPIVKRFRATKVSLAMGQNLMVLGGK